MKQSVRFFTVATLASTMAACGGGGSGDGSASASAGETGTMSFGLTDAPVTDLTVVNLNITSVELKPREGKSVTIQIKQIETEEGKDSRDINLLDYQAGDVRELFKDQEIPAGQYNWIRLHLGAEPYVQEEGSNPDDKLGLFVPSGFQTGLKLQGGFIIPAGGSANFAIDFDVRKSIVRAGQRGNGNSKYILKPTHRLIDRTDPRSLGSIAGMIDYASIIQDSALAECDYEGSVYIYSEIVPADQLTDLNSSNLDSEEGPLVVVPVTRKGEDSLYSYKAALLPAGETYTVAYSCQTDDNEDVDTLEFLGVQTVRVETNMDEPAEAKTIPLTP